MPRKSKSLEIRDYLVETFVDIELDEETLREEGWVRIEEVNEETPVHLWHDDFHNGPFAWCLERPCFDINRSK